MGNYGGNCGNVNVKGTSECCAPSTKDTNEILTWTPLLSGTLKKVNSR